jgi:hypothetical protein
MKKLLTFAPAFETKQFFEKRIINGSSFVKLHKVRLLKLSPCSIGFNKNLLDKRSLTYWMTDIEV